VAFSKQRGPHHDNVGLDSFGSCGPSQRLPVLVSSHSSFLQKGWVSHLSVVSGGVRDDVCHAGGEVSHSVAGASGFEGARLLEQFALKRGISQVPPAHVQSDCRKRV
jgi:hypothetical protein